MCGFTGFTNTVSDSETVLQDMKEKIKHRGPDGEGTYIDKDIALAFARLSIIDLENGDQPMFNEDRSLVLVFNGEIYNYQELREALLKEGHQFSSHSDSEVLLHAYEEYGPSFVKKLRGMFAFVIWDKNKRELFGARDIFGIKPFYYAQMEDCLLFGSEIKSFLPHPKFRKELNEKALEQYLSFQYSPYTETFFKGVFKLPPAHSFIYKDGSFSMSRYFQLEFDPDEDMLPQDWVNEVERSFDDSLSCHKISDVEVGSFLSGGVDSSYIASSSGVDKTFTVGFEQEGNYSEIPYAKELSKDIGVTNVSHVIEPESFFEKFPCIQYHMDEPLADPSAAALYFLCKTAAKHVKVVLSGEGADELFGGYNIYKEPLEGCLYEKLPISFRKLIAKLTSCFPARRGLNFLRRKSKPLEERFIGNAYIFTEKERHELLKQPTEAEAPYKLCSPYYRQNADQDPVTKMQYLDIHMWLTGDILLKADKMSMANSIELRVPFLDKGVLETARKIPAKYRIQDGNTKYVLRQAASRRMPDDWSSRKKLGFPVPIRVWLKEKTYCQHVEKVLASEQAGQFFHTSRLVHMLHQHQKGKGDYSRKIWTVYTFLIWHRQYFGEQYTV